MTVDHAWLPRATCDASCVSATDTPAGQRVVVAWRVAMRATFAVLLLTATPLLAIPVPGRSHIQRRYWRFPCRVARTFSGVIAD